MSAPGSTRQSAPRQFLPGGPGRVLQRLGLLVGLLILPLMAAALSLGELQQQSYLNEPFRAEIPVRSLQPGDLDNLKAQLAGDETFERFGLERSSLLLNLDFELLPADSQDAARIIVTSPDIFREPFFSFLLELKGGRERLIREYTVLLDPNTGDAGEPVAASTPQSAEPITPYIEEDTAQAPPPDAVIPPEPVEFESTDPVVTPRAKPQASAVIYEGRPVIDEGQYGPVRAGETLWGIAAAVRPSNQVTMNQVMWALFSFNENKFSGSISRLNKGAVLTVPSEQAMLDVSPAEASALVASAAQAPQAETEPAAPEQLAVEPAPAEQPVADAEPVEPVEMAEESEFQPPEEDLNLVAEEEEPAAEEPALQELPADGQAMADAGDEAATDDGGYEELPALPGGEEEMPAEEELADAGEMQELPAEPEELEALPQEPAEPSEPEALPDEPAAPQPLEPVDDADGGMLMWILIGAGVLLLGGGALMFLRKNKQETVAPAQRTTPPAAAPVDATQDLEDTSAEAEDMAAAARDVEEEAVAEAGPETEPKPDFADTAQFEMPPETSAEVEPEAGDELAELELPETEEITDEITEEIDEGEGTLDLGSETVSLELNEDPLSEADFQLAYGLYDEAALLLEKAIESTPERKELHEKLAETYFAASNAEKFREAAQNLKSRQPSEEVWQRIVIMGQQLCPDDELFSMDVDAGDSGAVDLDMGFDDTADVGTGSSGTESDDGHSIEFDMGEDAGSEAGSDSADEDSTQFEADFDNLDLDEADEDSDDALAGLDDLALDDLESELEGDDTGASEDAELSLEEPDAESSEAADEIDLDATAAFEVGDTQIFEKPPGEPATDDQASSADRDEPELSLVGEETDFGVDSESSDSGPDDLELELADDDTDFNLDSDAATSGVSEAAEPSEFELDEADVSADAGSDDLSTAEAGEFELADMEDSLSGGGAEDTDFDLSDLGDAESTDFDLDDSGAEGAEESTDFDLGSDSDSGAEDTDFDLSELGEDTDFDLGDDSVGENLDDLDLDDLGSDDELSLKVDDAEDSDLSADTGDISDGDEPGTKLDLATAYVEMGESDMARNLLDEVVAEGDDEQKAKAKELLDRL